MIKSQVLAVKSKLNEKLPTLQEVNNEVLRLVEYEVAYKNYQKKQMILKLKLKKSLLILIQIYQNLELRQLYTRSFFKLFPHTTSKPQYKTSSN